MGAHQLKDQSLSSYKPQNQMKNPRNYNHPVLSHPSESCFPLNPGSGLLYAPPPRSVSYSFPPSAHYYHHRQQPALLPLPTTNPQNFNPSRSRGLSCPPVNRKIKNRNTPTQRKSKPNAKTNLPNPVTVVESIANRLSPELKNLPSSRSFITNINKNCDVVNQVDHEFSGSVVFTDIAPPPSSLPLPTFFLRPKLSCNVEAAAVVDAGATNNLRSLLRLR